MKSKKVEISKINIKIGDKEISLSLEEAHELRQILDETFGKTISYPPSPIIIERPRPYWVWRYWDAPTITCGDSVGTVNFTLTSGNNSGPDPAPMLVS